jgi:hypothetical protein
MELVATSANVNVNITVTLEQAQKIVSVHRSDSDQIVISSFQEVQNHSYRCILPHLRGSIYVF